MESFEINPINKIIYSIELFSNKKLNLTSTLIQVLKGYIIKKIN